MLQLINICRSRSYGHLVRLNTARSICNYREGLREIIGERVGVGLVGEESLLKSIP